MKTESITNENFTNKLTLNFAHFYKSAAETNVKLIKKRKKKNSSRGIGFGNTKKVKINAEENSQSKNDLKESEKQRKDGSTAIVNNSDNTINFSNMEAEVKPKKRNKSVSFMLDDTEEVALKKTKSENFPNDNQNILRREIKPKKLRKNRLLKKVCLDETVDVGHASYTKLVNKTKETIEKQSNLQTTGTEGPFIKNKLNKRFKKHLKEKELDLEESKKVEKGVKIKTHAILKNELHVDKVDPVLEIQPASKKSKKKKPLLKPTQAKDETEGEPAVTEFHKGPIKPEAIAGNLENLSIGDNTNTLSNLLDEMTVDKNSKKKSKDKKRKGKPPKAEDSDKELEASQDKEKWKKKRWNKGNKGQSIIGKGLFPVTVENLPINIMLSYKKLLTEYFSKCGEVKRVGIAEVYPSEDIKPAFTTTVYFDNADGAAKALEEDNTSIEGSFIRVKPQFPSTETTAVVRTYGPMSEQILSSIFSGAGRIRRIRHMVKGKKFMATAFIELDGPDAVERAIKLAEEVTVGGKNIYVTKFDLKPKKGKKNKSAINGDDRDGDNSED